MSPSLMGTLLRNSSNLVNLNVKQGDLGKKKVSVSRIDRSMSTISVSNSYVIHNEDSTPPYANNTTNFTKDAATV